MAPISVLMPVHNARMFVAPAVQSILDQTFHDFELLIVDDGSTDGSLRVLQELTKRDSRVRIHSRANAGLIATLNEMLKMAQGCYVARMDADDLAVPDRFERQFRFLESNPDVAAVGGGLWLIDAFGRRIGEYCAPTSDSDIQRECLAGRCAINHPSVMMRAGLVRAAGGYDARMIGAEDIDLWLKLGERGKLANLSAKTTSYRVHPASVSAKRRVQQRENTRLACQEAWRRRGIEGILAESSEWRNEEARKARSSAYVGFGRWAFMRGDRATARAYAAKAITAQPLRMAGWRLLAASLVRSIPQIGAPSTNPSSPPA